MTNEVQVDPITDTQSGAVDILNTTRALSFWQLISFGFLTTPLAMSGMALVFFIPTFYAVDMGMGLATVGAVFVFGRIFDVITDPLIGYWSDQTRSRFGARRPFMIIGLPFFAISIWLLFMPPENASVLYLVFASACFFLLYTIVDVPYSSIGLEISPHVHERTMLASSKSIFQIIGAITTALIPVVLLTSGGATLSVLAKAIIVLSVMGLVLFVIFMPQHNRPITAPRMSFFSAIKWVFARSTYRYLISAFFVVQSANALTTGLLLLYVTHVLKAPHLIGQFLLVIFLSTALVLPVWVIVSRKYSKKTAWMASIILSAFGLAMTPLIGAGDVLLFFMLSAILGASFGADAVMPTSMLADIVSESESDGQNRTSGTYLAIKNAVSKLTFIVPMGLAFPVLELVGFDKSGANSSTHLSTLIFFFATLPILLRLVTLLIIRRAPTTQAELASHAQKNNDSRSNQI